MLINSISYLKKKLKERFFIITIIISSFSYQKETFDRHAAHRDAAHKSQKHHVSCHVVPMLLPMDNNLPDSRQRKQNMSCVLTPAPTRRRVIYCQGQEGEWRDLKGWGWHTALMSTKWKMSCLQSRKWTDSPPHRLSTVHSSPQGGISGILVYIYCQTAAFFISKSRSKFNVNYFIRLTVKICNISNINLVGMRILSCSDQLPVCELHVLPTVFRLAADPAASSTPLRNSTLHDHETLRQVLSIFVPN